MTESNVIVAPRIRDLEELASQLAGWLRERLPEGAEPRVHNLEYPTGAGRSNETILFDATWSESGQSRTRGLVVRIKPTEHQVFPDNVFDEQQQVMMTLHEQGHVKVARIYWTEDDPSILGAPFYVMEKIAGRVAVNEPPYIESGWVVDATPAQRRKMWESGVRQLAAIQLTPASDLGFLAPSDPAQSGFEQEWDRYVRFLAGISKDQRWPLLEDALRELGRSFPRHRPEGLVWGDARIGNMMFDENFEVATVMDWEQPSLGGALHDLGYWIHVSNAMHGDRPGRPGLTGMGSRDETIALWREVCGKPVDDLEWYEAFARLKTSIVRVRMCRLRDRPKPDDEELSRMLRPAA